ncbi:MAG: extracellular solute-binding protein [Chloroflexi bacterium]|nr:extracellular solute-binding protein [Chloroflexota bacterium]
MTVIHTWKDLPAAQYSRARALRGAAALVGGALGAALVGCGSEADSGAAQQKPGVATTPVSLQFLTQTLEAFPDVFDTLKKQMPNVTVETSVAGGYPFVEKALALGVAGSPPDFSYANVRFIPALANAGLLHDANSYFKKDKLDLSGVAKPVLEDYTWKGTMPTLPLDMGMGYVRYNKTLIERAGQPDPGKLWQDKKWNWDAFVAMATALSRTPPGEPERTGYVIRTWEGDYLAVVRTFGGEVLNKDRSKYVLEDNAGVAALNAWASLATRYKASPLPDRMPQGGFNAGQLALVASHPGEIVPTRKAIKDASASWRWDVVPHPAPTGKRVVPTLFSNGFHFWKGAKNEATTAEALKRLIGPELTLEWGVRTGRQPARTSLTAEYAKRLDIPTQDPQSYIKLVQELENAVRGLDHSPTYVEWHTILVKEVLLPVGRGEKSAQDAARGAAPQINAVLARK